MLSVHKAYLNGDGRPKVLTLQHDVKRCLIDAKASDGLLTITSNQATVAVALVENDPSVQKQFLDFLSGLFQNGPELKTPRRSGSGADRFHLMAAMPGLSLTLGFQNGRLLASPFHEVVALDFEPKPGRREFILSVLTEAAPAQATAGGAPRR